MTDAEFEAIVARLDLNHVEEGEVQSVKKMTDEALVVAYNQIRRDLNGLRELRQPSTVQGRDLQSRRSALIVEMRERGLS
jgi:hypothetical protein